VEAAVVGPEVEISTSIEKGRENPTLFSYTFACIRWSISIFLAGSRSLKTSNAQIGDRVNIVSLMDGTAIGSKNFLKNLKRTTKVMSSWMMEDKTDVVC